MSNKLAFLCILVLPMAGCSSNSSATVRRAAATTSAAPVFVSVVSDLDTNRQAVDMALKLAGFALDEGRDVFLFFNVKGVNVPLKSLADDVSFGDGPPVKEQLSQLIQRGASIHACPVCMKALAINDVDLAEGVEVTDRAALFSKISSDTCVFTY